MKKWLTILCAIAAIIAAAVAFWPRLDIPEGAAVSLLYTGENLSQRYHALDAETSAAICAQFDGHLLLPDWTDVFTGQRFYFSSAYASQGFLIEWAGDRMLLILPKQGTRHLLQLNGDDALIWLNADELDMLSAVFEAQGVYYPRVIPKQ